MKKHLSLALCLSLFSTPFMHADTLIPEIGTLGVGAILTALGLKLMHKSTKKKGTAGQAISGVAITAAGLATLTQGPRYVREGKGWSFKKLTGKAGYAHKKIKTVEFVNTKIEQEKNLFLKAAFQFYVTALKLDPFEMIPVRSNTN